MASKRGEDPPHSSTLIESLWVDEEIPSWPRFKLEISWTQLFLTFRQIGAALIKWNHLKYGPFLASSWILFFLFLGTVLAYN